MRKGVGQTEGSEGQVPDSLDIKIDFNERISLCPSDPDIRIFDDRTKKQVFYKQTSAAKLAGTSNCPLCALESNPALNLRLYKLNEMDADHVTAWSHGGATTEQYRGGE